MMNKDNNRTLEEICDGEAFCWRLQSIDYCRLAIDPNRSVDCKYLVEIPDHNKLHRCSRSDTTPILQMYKGDEHKIYQDTFALKHLNKYFEGYNKDNVFLDKAIDRYRKTYGLSMFEVSQNLQRSHK